MHTAVINRISTYAIGKYFLTASDDKTAKLWDAATGELFQTLRPPIGESDEGMLFAGALSPD
jgi:WD40 repeat protein